MKSNECSDDLIKHLANIPDCPDFIRFFLIFSRIEYALKRSEYVSGDENNPKADWETFGKEIASVFNKHKCQELEEAIEYLKNNPPKKQILKIQNERRELDWRCPHEKLPEIQLLINAVKRVRNNLFHGGKYPSRPVADPSRNGELIKHSITVLKYLLYSSDKVKNHYDEPLG